MGICIDEESGTVGLLEPTLSEQSNLHDDAHNITENQCSK